VGWETLLGWRGVETEGGEWWKETVGRGAKETQIPTPILSKGPIQRISTSSFGGGWVEDPCGPEGVFLKSFC